MYIGIIGTGSRTDDYIIPYISGQLPEFEIKAMSDINENRLKEFSAKYFKDSPMPQLYTDYKDLLDDEEITAVLVCTPDTTHREIAVESMRKGKHILLEKPLATTLEDCLDIYRESLKHDTVFHLAFGMRQSPLYQKVREIVASGQLGRIMAVESNETLGYIHAGSFFRRWQRFRANSGGFLNYKCCHDLDIMNWIIGSDPAYISAFGSRSYFNPREDAADVCRDCRLGDTCRYYYRPEDYYELFGQFGSLEDICVFNCQKDIIDHEVVNIIYKNDVTVSFTVSMPGAEGSKHMTVFGSEATLHVDSAKQTITVRYIHPSNETVYKIGKDNRSMDSGTYLLKRFHRCIEENAGSSDAKAGLLSSGLALMAEKSMEDHMIYDISTITGA